MLPPIHVMKNLEEILHYFFSQRWHQICKGTKLQQNFVFTTLLFEKDVGDMLLEHASSHNLKTKMRALKSASFSHLVEF